MIDICILEGLSFSGAASFLLEYGYRLIETIKQKHDDCDVLYIYPFVLYSEWNKVIDRIGHFEFCMYDKVGEPVDYKSYWERF